MVGCGHVAHLAHYPRARCPLVLLVMVHLGANVVGRQLLATAARPAQEESIHDLLERLEALSAA